MPTETEFLYMRSCAGKVAYTSPAKARTGMHASLKLHPGKRYGIYQCIFCAHWHVGSTKRKFRGKAYEPLRGC